MFDPVLAEIRFGCGRSPRLAAPDSINQMLAGLLGPDRMATEFPIDSFESFGLRLADYRRHGKIRRDSQDAATRDAAEADQRAVIKKGRHDQRDWLVAHVLRRVNSTTPLRERLEGFWADHFTVWGKSGPLRTSTSTYVSSAIRPRLVGSFGDLLVAAVTHPLMLHYLDQQGSAGPNAPQSLKHPGRLGFNENLAREVLELHTLGVGGPYAQNDVRELAELLTGLAYRAETGTEFRRHLAEPGAETVLGRRYGGDGPARLEDIHAALHDLAKHPATARHIATKLARHFVSDTPDPDLIAFVEDAWLDTSGDLLSVYYALLTHPAAWDPVAANIKQPFDFITSACRALDIPGAVLRQRVVPMVQTPLRLMGHYWQEPPGPDGLSEDDSTWISPQGIAARLQWAFMAPQVLRQDLPDPRAFVETALGPHAPEVVRFAASAAETRADGIGVVLASPAFQRM